MKTVLHKQASLLVPRQVEVHPTYIKDKWTNRVFQETSIEVEIVVFLKLVRTFDRECQKE